MAFVQKGIYIYEDSLNNIKNDNLPSQLVISERTSNEAILIRLLCGTLKIKYFIEEDQIEINQHNNYSVPGIEENSIFKDEIIKDFFSLEDYTKLKKKIIDKYINSNRKNHFVHEELLSELTGAIIWMRSSPIESFVHIYRSLEFISYSFPLIYASKSMDYRGSYEKLKKFMSGDSDGELKFFKIWFSDILSSPYLIYFLHKDYI